jgi:peptide/nickel transport system permease protein
MSVIAASAFFGSKPQRRRTRDVDWPLFAGMIFFGALVVLAIYGPLVAPHDLYFTRSLLNGTAPPFPPGAAYPFGSDAVGHDRFSWLLIGARTTVATALGAAFLRVAVGASLGLLAGAHGGTLALLLRRIALGLSSVPATVAAVLAVIGLGLRPEQFVIALGLVGWAEPFHQTRRYARAESARPFIESARSLGVPEGRLLLRHLMPNVAPALLTTAAFQVSAVFLLMGELALLNLFAGGAAVIDYDASGRAVVVPAYPTWASMLGTTRPIVSLYGDLAAVLLPGGALLGAVLATNLFGDALAARAQRLDVFRLFSRRQLLALGTVALVMVLTTAAWPSRLATELGYARPANGTHALSVARELVAPDLAGRVTSSDGAARGATILAERLGGTIVRDTDEITRVVDAEVTVGSHPITSARVLSTRDADVSAPLAFVAPSVIFDRSLVGRLEGSVVALDGPPASILGPFVQRLAAAGARAVVVVDRGGQNYRSATYEIPTVAVGSESLATALGGAIPDPRNAAPSFVVARSISIGIRTERVRLPVLDVVAHIGKPDRAVVVVAAPYDSAAGSNAGWPTASAAATLSSVVERLREDPVDAEVIAVATAADQQNYAGLRVALSRLSNDERGRLSLIVLIGPVLSDHLVIRTEGDTVTPSGAARLAARLHDATGVDLENRVAGTCCERFSPLASPCPC